MLSSAATGRGSRSAPCAAGGPPGYACESTAATCSDNANFGIVPTAPASGTINYSGGGAGTVDIDITVSSATMSGAFDGVGQLIFGPEVSPLSGPLRYQVSGWNAFVDGTGTIQGLGAATGTVRGSYEQRDASGTVVVVPATNFLASVQFTGFVCPASGQGLCSFTVGALRDFQLAVGQTGGGTSHDVVHVFDVVVPEPSTAGLMLLGLAGLTFAGRPRR